MQHIKKLPFLFFILLFCNCASHKPLEITDEFLLYNSTKVTDFLRKQNIKVRDIKLGAVERLTYKVCWVVKQDNPLLYYAIDFNGKYLCQANPFSYYEIGELFMINNRKLRKIVKDDIIYITLQ